MDVSIWRQITGLGILFQLLAGSVAATSFSHKTFEQAVKDSDGIVRGTVGTSYSNWVKEEGANRLFTFIELTLDEVVKGQVPGTLKTLILRELGGEKDGVGLNIAGAARFRRGEEVVVFVMLPANSDGSYTLRGLMMGKYEVVRGDDGTPMLRGGRLAQPVEDEGHSDTGDGKLTGNAQQKKWTLQALRDLVREQRSAGTSVDSTGSKVPPLAPSTPAPRLQPSTQGPGGPRGGENVTITNEGETWLSYRTILVGLAVASLALGIWLIRRR